MKRDKHELELSKKFTDFIESEQVAPNDRLDGAVLNMVRKELRPALWKVYGKLTLVEATAGLLTLTICPQFGFGLGQHNQFLHALHSSTPPAVFYLLCGLFFVLIGATLGGLLLNRAEIRTIGRSRYFYFAVYSVLAFLLLLALGTEAFVVSSLVWILGALLGNILGFEAAIRLRQATSGAEYGRNLM